MSAYVGLLAVFFMPLAGVQEKDVLSELAECVELADSLLRLQCFDKVAASALRASRQSGEPRNVVPAGTHEERIARLVQSIKDKQEGKTGESSDAILGKRTSASGTASPQAVRVEGDIKPPKKIKDVNPHYPDVARQARIQGIVILEAIIDPRGKVRNVRVLRSIPGLDQPAIDAVRQWRYEPTLLNGVPVPIVMTVTVNFALQSPHQE